MKFLSIEINKIEAVGIIVVIFCIALMIKCLVASFSWTIAGLIISSVALILTGGWQDKRIDNDIKAA